MRNLLIISQSKARKKGTGLKAIERFDGLFFKIIKQLKKEGNVPNNLDILIITSKYGIVNAEEKVSYYKSKETTEFIERRLKTHKDLNFKKLKQLQDTAAYSRIFICAGKAYRQSIEDFINYSKDKIEYCKGPGLGTAAQHLKQWILSL